MTVKELREKLNKYDGDTQICVYDNCGNFYEKIKALDIAHIRKHEDVYAGVPGDRFIDSYKKEFQKHRRKNIIAIYY